MKKALFYITLALGIIILFVAEVLQSLPFFATAYFIYQDQFKQEDQRSLVLGASLFFLMINLFTYSFEDVVVWGIVFFVYFFNKD